MSTLEWALQLVLLALLGAALPFVWRLERRLSALRRERGALEAGAADFAEAARTAEATLLRLRATAEGAGKGIAERIATAEPLRDDLRYLVERAELLADRLEALVRAARPIASAAEQVPPASAAAAPRSRAERELLRALQLGGEGR